MTASSDTIIEVCDVCTRFGSVEVHRGVNLDVRRGEILALAGGSGSGKTTLMHEIIMLRAPTSGSIRVLGEEVVGISEDRATELRRHFGVLFQYGALFSGITVLQNVGVPLREHTSLSDRFIDEISAVKIVHAGLPAEAASLYPRELSGGMMKRAGLARAMVMDPDILFLDEPTAGLDPNAASAFDELVLALKELLGLTVVMVTHDLDTLWKVADRVAVLGDGKVVGIGGMQELMESEEPLVQKYFSSPRAQIARAG